jgi:hypothetical protein
VNKALDETRDNIKKAVKKNKIPSIVPRSG